MKPTSKELKNILDDLRKPVKVKSYNVPDLLKTHKKIIDYDYSINGNFKNIVNQISKILELKENPHFLFTGDIGTGKTFLMNIINKYFTELGMITSKYETRKIYQLYLKLVGSNFSDKNEQIYKLFNIGKKNILLLDDLGTEKMKENEISFTRNLILDRHEAIYNELCYSSVITTNLTFNQLKKIYGSRVVDRLMESFYIVRFTGASMRKSKLKIIK